MRLIKTTGLVAVLAVAASALIGASTATATEFTTLCTEKTAVLTCPEAKQLSGAHFVSPKTKTTILTNVVTITCEILFGAAAHEGITLGKPLFLVGHFTFSECSNSCVIEEINGPSVAGLLKTAPELALVAPEAEFTVSCGVLIKCTYNTSTTNGHALGGAATEASELTHLTFNKAPLFKVAGFCPTTATLDALFASLEKLYIRT